MVERALVGIQISGISFLDEGDEVVLDRLVDCGGVNTLVLVTQAFDGGVQGRHDPGPWPGHGSKEPYRVVGGSYVMPHPDYFSGTVLPAFRAPDKEFVGIDILERIIPKAQARGMRVFSWVYENPYTDVASHVPNWVKVAQEDVYGRRHSLPCFRNPDYLLWWLSIVEDQLKSYPIDGIQYGSERYGPLGNTLQGGVATQSPVPYCFCAHCRRAGQDRGIDPERARKGFRLLYESQHLGGFTDQNQDGPLVRVLRLLLRYPEILAWEQLWHDGYTTAHRQIYGVAKAVAPDRPVGWHVWHQNSLSPLYRAETDFSSMTSYSDFIKPVLYHNCAGPRLHRHIERTNETIFSGTYGQQLFELYQDMLGYAENFRFDEISTSGLSGDYVQRETARTVAATEGKVPIYPGVDVDIPTRPDEKKTTPNDVRAGVIGAFEGGASGVILSRKYSEMQLGNLAAAGKALRELGKA